MIKEDIIILLELCNYTSYIYNILQYILKIPIILIGIGNGIVNSVASNEKFITIWNIITNFLLSVLMGSDMMLQLEAKANNLKKHKIQLKNLKIMLDETNEISDDKMKKIEIMYNTVCDNIVEPIPDFIKNKIKKKFEGKPLPKIFNKKTSILSFCKNHKVGSRIVKRFKKIIETITYNL